MQADINKTKSRCYNYFLRHFHIGLRIIAVIFSTKIIPDNQNCSPMINKFVFPLALTLTILNLCFIIYFSCKESFPRCQFFLFLSINVIICSVIGLLTYSYFSNDYRCTKTLILQSYIVLQVIFNVIVCLLVLFGKFEWEQRYTNTPGNLVWTLIIIQFSQQMNYVLQIQLIQWITAGISIASLVINVVSLITGITSCMKKTILVEWIVGLTLIVICVLISFVLFLSNYFLRKHAHQILSNIALKYILVSLIDIGFWVWGLLTLTYENGDYIRNAILYPNEKSYSRDETQFQIEHYLKEHQLTIKHHESPLDQNQYKNTTSHRTS